MDSRLLAFVGTIYIFRCTAAVHKSYHSPHSPHCKVRLKTLFCEAINEEAIPWPFDRFGKCESSNFTDTRVRLSTTGTYIILIRDLTKAYVFFSVCACFLRFSVRVPHDWTRARLCRRKLS